MNRDSEVVISRFAFNLGTITAQIHQIQKDKDVLEYFRRGNVNPEEFRIAEEILIKIANGLYQDFKQ